MGNKFVDDKDFNVIGIVHVICKKPDGEIRFEGKSKNTVKDALKFNLCNAIKGGTFPAISNYATTHGSTFTDWASRDGIMVFNSANTTEDGTLLKCVSTGANSINSMVIQGTNSLFDDSTMTLFAMGTSVNTDTAFDTNFFEHPDLDFAYSSGDTITVNWTVSVT